MAAQDGGDLQEEDHVDLRIALLMEHEILSNQGIQAPCGCTKFVMCSFPTTCWYYATLCRHDDTRGFRAITELTERAYWWYDLARRCMVSAALFGQQYGAALIQQKQLDPSLLFAGPSEHPFQRYLDVRMGEKCFLISRAGLVKRLYPSPGGWL